MRQHRIPLPRKKISVAILAIAGLFFVFSLIISVFVLKFANKIVPNVYLDTLSVGGMTKVQAIELLFQKYGKLESMPEISVSATISGVVVHEATPSASLGFHRNINEQVDRTFAVGRSGSLKQNIIEVVGAARNSRKFATQAAVDPLLLKQWISSVAVKADKKGVEPSASLGIGGVLINAGKDGWKVDQQQLITTIADSDISQIHTFSLPVIQTERMLTNDEIKHAYTRANMFVSKQIALYSDNIYLSLPGTQLLSFLSFPDGYNQETINKAIEQWRGQIDRPAQNPDLKITDKKVTAFTPPQNGLAINKRATNDLMFSILKSIENNEKLADSYDLPTQITPPSIALGDTNTFGIRERIGVGESLFYHSIPNRVHNVALAATALNNALIAPGDTLSLNTIIGDISQQTGYLQAYVIQQGRTVLGDGGGVCQVSTTLFRSALNAGLPIIERHGHGYRVGYYEEDSKPGFDATVFAPSVDLKIKNDTPGYMLVRTITDLDNRHLTIELWGAADGRKSEITGWRIWDQVPALPTIYQDDSTIPPGTMKQVDFSAPGAKTSFKYHVTRDGKTLIDQLFTTVYQPWAAIYLRGI